MLARAMNNADDEGREGGGGEAPEFGDRTFFSDLWVL